MALGCEVLLKVLQHPAAPVMRGTLTRRTASVQCTKCWNCNVYDLQYGLYSSNSWFHHLSKVPKINVWCHYDARRDYHE